MRFLVACDDAGILEILEDRKDNLQNLGSGLFAYSGLIVNTHLLILTMRNFTTMPAAILSERHPFSTRKKTISLTARFSAHIPARHQKQNPEKKCRGVPRGVKARERGPFFRSAHPSPALFSSSSVRRLCAPLFSFSLAGLSGFHGLPSMISSKSRIL